MNEMIEVKIPDIGDFDEVDVIEVLVSPGDVVEAEDSLITLESDKASMEVPAPQAGTVKELKVSAGDKVGQGAVILLLETEANGKGREEAPEGKPSSDETVAPEADSGSAAETSETPNPVATREELPEADLKVQLVVLGSGPGGYSAAFRAADLGMEVLLVERYPTLGGVCLNVGCIPSKALLHAAEVIEQAETFGEQGIAFGKPKIDLDGLRGWKDGVVAKLTGGLKTLAKARKVETLQGVGRLQGPHLLEVATGDGTTTVAFEKIILAAGSQVAKLPFVPYEDPRVMDSTGALELEEIPKRLLILGGGIIGLEMATVYHALGSKITVVELLDGLIPGADRDIVRPLARRLVKRYENIFLKTKVTAIEAQKKGLKVSFEGTGKKDGAPETAHFDRVLVAVGRKPNGGEIGAEAAGIEVDERGFIATDRQMRTNVEHIFAIGDLTSNPMLAHKAVHEGHVAAEVAAGETSSFDARVIPSVAYTDPEVAWVGLTETQAKEDGTAYEKASIPWAASGRALALGAADGTTKLLFDPETRRVLGAGIAGPHAGDLISEVALAIEMGCEAADIALTIHPHPTLSETVAFSAEAFEGTITDLYLPKRAKKGS